MYFIQGSVVVETSRVSPRAHATRIDARHACEARLGVDATAMLCLFVRAAAVLLAHSEDLPALIGMESPRERMHKCGERSAANAQTAAHHVDNLS
jgi:hypothetical protein